MDINVVFEDKYIAVIEKPVGIPVQEDKSGDISVLDILKKQLSSEVWLVHRLDRPVGGLMVIAKSCDCVGKLSESVKNKEVKKLYRAVVCGDVKKEGVLSDYIMKNQRLNITKVVNKGNVGAKLAELEYTKIAGINDERYGYISLVEINLLTGRHHQIRVQMMNMGTPLWGDIKYNPIFKHKRGVSVALWSYGLDFKHPITNEELSFRLEPKGEIFDCFGGSINEV